MLCFQFLFQKLLAADQVIGRMADHIAHKAQGEAHIQHGYGGVQREEEPHPDQPHNTEAEYADVSGNCGFFHAAADAQSRLGNDMKNISPTHKHRFGEAGSNGCRV